MNQLPFFLAQTFRGMRGRLWMQFLTIGAVCGGAMLVGMAFMAKQYVDQLTEQWRSGEQLIVYFQMDTPEKAMRKLDTDLRTRADVQSVRFTSSQEARLRLKQSLGRGEYLLDSIEADFFPASIEVTLTRAMADHERQSLLAFIRASSEVESVEDVGGWARQLGTVSTVFSRLVWVFCLIVALACIYFVTATVRMGVFARREEIEVQKLVGATEKFIRVPFLIEGVLQGLVGAVTAWTVLYLAYLIGAPRIEATLAEAFFYARFQFLPGLQIFFGVIVCVFVGALGGQLAVNRHIDV